MVYDVIIIGAGPAGLSAGLYAGRSRLKTLIIERAQDGGQIAITDEIENYPGSLPEHESGKSLVARMAGQAKSFGAERLADVVKSVSLEGGIKKVACAKGTFEARAVIIATGAHPRPIGCENEGRFIGKGISFCATCDAAFFEGMEVFVAGGGDSAVEEALYLTKFARKVTIVHRRDALRAAKSIQEKAFKNDKIHFLWNSVIVSVDGDGVMSSMKVKDTRTGVVTEFQADEDDGMFGLFGFLGYVPNSELFQGLLPLESGYIRTDEDMHTGIPGVFAAGDIRVKSLRQVVTATADGAIAAMQAERYISGLE
ncbi:thioredoxin reductase (NADPH) [Sporobacter termitidis DSM 10068]|uniref:Thioredoxin reductase n=1 Tax=Sporobacter termitidis DSM 10068 TaxID=1123282 RepID=A0A1M5UCH4_9FIRM|nr:thioredoxin-disulfide reductase [Sporobacter termitidis]SHH60373.1 thioredoxin reductase (NADPH) [Sporobacter termitidis DSM 10068]